MAHRRNQETLAGMACARPVAERRKGRRERSGCGRGRAARGKKNDLLAGERKPAGAGALAHNPLGAVPKDGITQTLWSSEGDPSWAAFALRIKYHHAHQGMVVPPSLGIHALKVRTRLDGLHTEPSECPRR